ncbi:MAG: tetratricopeptide repeat protein [Magnetospirillum sp. WYHS-4]
MKAPDERTDRKTAKVGLRWQGAVPSSKKVAAPEEPSATAIRSAVARSREMRAGGRFREAAEAMLALAGAAPGAAEVQEELARVLRGMGDGEGAIAAYRRATELAPAKGDHFYQLGAVLVERRRAREAEAAADRLLALEPDQSRGHALKGLALRAAGSLEAAALWLERAMVLAPADFTTLNALMMTLYGLGRIEEARARGLAALVHKDRQALADFARSPMAGLTVSRRAAPFDATRPRRNVIAFSLWGDRPEYTHGAIVNAQIAPHIYKGWTCRFYCDDTVPRVILEELRHLKAQVIPMPERNAVASGAFWRFLASDDPEVDRFVCRDVDSRVNCKEKAAVDAWIASGRMFHAMRDHIYHNELILAGMWGGVARVLPNLDALSRRGHRFSGVRHADQNFLRGVVWPMIRDDLLVHDSQYRFAGSQDFPGPCGLPAPFHVGWSERDMPAWTPR